jgi:hypothetical protein
MINKAYQDAPQYAEPMKPPGRLPASNQAFIGSGVLAGAGGLAVLGGRRLGRMNPIDPRSSFLRSKGKRTAFVGAGLASYGAYAQNRNKKNGFVP